MKITVLHAHAAPSGHQRFLTWLADAFHSPELNHCRMVVAFAKRSGVARVLPHISAFRKRGGKVSAIVGIDVRGTSLEALQLLTSAVDTVYVTHQPGSSCTFHPKIYLFDGVVGARAMVGSHNLTSGGLELNYEAGVSVEFDFPCDKPLWTEQFEPAWNNLLPGSHANTVPLDHALLAILVDSGLVVRERDMQGTRRDVESSADATSLPFQGISMAPPSALPSTVLMAPEREGSAATFATPVSAASLGLTLVIQVKPHHNAEVFLSKRALDQNPNFFGWPWTGTSTPKKGKNKGYPQREPTPVTLIRVHDSSDKVIFERSVETLMVYYTTKSEVRVTIGQEAMTHIPEMSIVVIRSAEAGLMGSKDFEWNVYPPDSPSYSAYLAVCDQTLPGGGKQSRRMGWL